MKTCRLTLTVTGARESSTDRNAVTKFNEGDKVRITGGYIVSGGILEVGHEATIVRVEEEEHIHEESEELVDSYELDSGYYATEDELELVQ